MRFLLTASHYTVDTYHEGGNFHQKNVTKPKTYDREELLRTLEFFLVEHSNSQNFETRGYEYRIELDAIEIRNTFSESARRPEKPNNCTAKFRESEKITRITKMIIKYLLISFNAAARKKRV
jgi:hypothetical protein